MGFQSTSEIFGGAQAYNPGSTYFPLTDYMSKSGFTHAANVHTCFGIIQADPFVTATQSYRSVFRSVHSGNTIGSLNLQPTDAATAPAGGQMFGRDSVGGVMFDIRCSDVLVDGNKHWFFFAYNAATADYIFIVDGKDATIVAETANTGTQSSGASAAMGLGSNDAGTATVDYQGEISFFGYDDSYRENWYDFFESDGTPKEIDTAGWTEWGAQPLVFNPHADLRNNLGSLGNFTANGTDMRAGDMMNNAIPYRGLATIGDINSNLVPYGKVGWANAQRYAGIHNPLDRGIIADYWVPINSAIATNDWDPSADFEGRLVVCNGLADQATTYTGKDWNRTAAGCAYNANSYAPLVDLRNAPIPARTLNLRRYYFEWMQFSASVASANDGINFIVNFVDNSNFNFVQVILVGSQYQIRYIERVAGADTTRSTITYSSIVDEPCYGWVMFDDWGDSILLSSGGFETDNAASDHSIFRNFYGAGGRPNQAGTGFYVGMGQVTTTARFGIRGFSVRELG